MTNNSSKKSKTSEGPKLGALPAPPELLRKAQPFPSDELAEALVLLPQIPPVFMHRLPGRISMWGNFHHFDCATAEEAFAKACEQPEIFISDDTVIAWATAHNFLEWSVIADVMDEMQASGFSQDGHTYQDGARHLLDFRNPAAVRLSITEGPVKIGVAGNQLLATWKTTGGDESGAPNGWMASGYQADSPINHCASLCGYGSISWLAAQLDSGVPAGLDGSGPGYAIFTWGSIGIIDEASLHGIIGEAWLRIPTTRIA